MRLECSVLLCASTALDRKEAQSRRNLLSEAPDGSVQSGPGILISRIRDVVPNTLVLEVLLEGSSPFVAVVGVQDIWETSSSNDRFKRLLTDLRIF